MNHTYLTDRQLAERFNVSRATIWRWSSDTGFPSPIKLGDNCSRWKLADIQEWEKAREAA